MAAGQLIAAGIGQALETDIQQIQRALENMSDQNTKSGAGAVVLANDAIDVSEPRACAFAFALGGVKRLKDTLLCGIDLIQKPFHRHELLKEVRRLLDSSTTGGDGPSPA